MKKIRGCRGCCEYYQHSHYEKFKILVNVLVSSKIEQPRNLVQHGFKPVPSQRQISARERCGHSQIIRPALLNFSRSFLKSSIFSSNFLPENSTPRTLTFSFGRGGRSSPHMRSIRLFSSPKRLEPPFFLILSNSLRAPAVQILVMNIEKSSNFARSYSQ